MSWIFRKIFRIGPFSTTLSKGGVGVSWGIPGFRFGISANGRKYLTVGIPGTGIYFTKYFNQTIQHHQLPPPSRPEHPQPFQQNNSQPINKKEEHWWKQKNL